MLPMRHDSLIMIASTAPALASCGSSELIRVGFLGSLSGRASDLEIGGLNAARLAVDLHTRTVGIKGRQIELSEADDQRVHTIENAAFVPPGSAP